MPTKQEIEKMIKEQVDLITRRTFNKRIGDTPTDSLQLVPKKSLYNGYVDSNGQVTTPFFIPAGWTLTKGSTGLYTLTHNFNSVDYVIIGSTYKSGSSNSLSFNIDTKSANSFILRITDLNDALIDGAFHFLVIRR